MPRFVVTKSVDAFVNYGAVVEAANASEAGKIAENDHDSFNWVETGTYELDHVDFDNIEPQEVADDFTLESETDLFADLLAAFKEAVAFHDGEENETLAYWDSLIERAERR